MRRIGLLRCIKLNPHYLRFSSSESLVLCRIEYSSLVAVPKQNSKIVFFMCERSFPDFQTSKVELTQRERERERDREREREMLHKSLKPVFKSSNVQRGDLKLPASKTEWSSITLSTLFLYSTIIYSIRNSEVFTGKVLHIKNTHLHLDPFYTGTDPNGSIPV